MDGDVDFLPKALRVLVEGIMHAEVSSRIGAEYGERSPERSDRSAALGNGSRTWDHPWRDDEAAHPEAQRGELLRKRCWTHDRCSTSDHLPAVIQQAYVEGVSTRRVEPICRQEPWGVRVSTSSQVSSHLSGAGRGGGWLLGPSAGRWTLPRPVVGRPDPEGQGVTAGSSTSAMVVATAVNGRAAEREIIGQGTWVPVKTGT